MKEVTAAIIIEDGKILIAKRKDGNIKGKWEFPGGKVEENETFEDCLKREIKEELDMEIEIVRPFETIIHEYENGKIKLISFIVRPITKDIVLSSHDDVKWVEKGDLLNYDLAAADIPIAQKLVIDIHLN